MLSKSENEVMSAVYSLCDGTDSCLISPLDIMSLLPLKKKYTQEYIDGILNDLKRDGYFDLITSVRKGEKAYVIILKDSGMSFKRLEEQKQRDVTFKIFLAFIGAFATFIFGLILKGIFG